MVFRESRSLAGPWQVHGQAFRKQKEEGEFASRWRRPKGTRAGSPTKNVESSKTGLCFCELGEKKGMHTGRESNLGFEEMEDPKPETRNPKPETRNPKPETLSPKP